MSKMPGVSAIGVIGNGMIGDSMTVPTTGHGYKTVSVVRSMDRVPVYKAKRILWMAGDVCPGAFQMNTA